MDILSRIMKMELPRNKSAFLWGPRKVGKSYWLREHFAEDLIIDFLKTDIYAEYISRPALLRERYASTKNRIIIDEVQMVPAILNEVHWLIENKNISFILTGSSPRKLKRDSANLLGGRAWRYTMTPLCYPEVKNIDIENVMITGMLPPHVLSEDPIQDFRSYVADYLKEEIIAEAAVQNIPAFSEFLRVSALTTGELLNYTNVARETGVSAKVVRSYFQILEDTLLGFRLQPWRKVVNRRLIETEKFYLFDVGLANYLLRRQPKIGTAEFGKSFEHYIMLELMAYKAYINPELPIYFWRTSSGQEVDFILGEMDLAVEIKTSKRIDETDTRSLQLLASEHKVKKSVIVSFESEVKQLGQVECLPWQVFLEKLWNNEFF
ncbi:MAG: ATP-binding protein [Proteobacteria bacterium]|nr:ATP-binding protein [Pseudomonadota bacterium]